MWLKYKRRMDDLDGEEFRGGIVNADSISEIYIIKMKGTYSGRYGVALSTMMCEDYLIDSFMSESAARAELDDTYARLMLGYSPSGDE